MSDCYLENWDDFYRAAEKLYSENPKAVRYVSKYRHKDALLILKVTNNKVVFKYRATRQSDIKKIEQLNNLFLRNMSENPKKGQAKK